jgi:hypothetical protein
VTRPTATRMAWLSWAVSLMLGLASVALLILTRETPIPRGAVPRGMVALWVLLLLVILSTMGALIVARRPANLIGWSFVAAGLGLALSAFGGLYAVYALLTNPGSLPGAAWLAWIPTWLTIPAIYSAFAALLLLFPTGRLLVSLATGGLAGGRLDRRGRRGQLHLPTRVPSGRGDAHRA